LFNLSKNIYIFLFMCGDAALVKLFDKKWRTARRFCSGFVGCLFRWELIQKPRSQPNDSSIAAERRAAMSWAQRLKRVFRFSIDIETCSTCGGAMKVIASIEDPVVINKILGHLDSKTAVSNSLLLPDNRAPPQADLFY
jgi:hypothetical protein